MTHACCSACRLRLSGADAASLSACPSCAGPLTRRPTAASVLGYRLFERVAQVRCNPQDRLLDAVEAARTMRDAKASPVLAVPRPATPAGGPNA
jgi:hypothetical protein